MRKGLFISVEGSDGSGKSTQIENIKRFFENKGINIIFTREPGGTVIGEKLREIILDKGLAEMRSAALCRGQGAACCSGHKTRT